MATVNLNVRIMETIRYVGHVSVDQDQLSAWMKAEGHAELTGEVLQNFVIDHNIKVEETDDDVQGQDWDNVRPSEGQDPAEVTLPLQTQKA